MISTCMTLCFEDRLVNTQTMLLLAQCGSHRSLVALTLTNPNFTEAPVSRIRLRYDPPPHSRPTASHLQVSPLLFDQQLLIELLDEVNLAVRKQSVGEVLQMSNVTRLVFRVIPYFIYNRA